MCTVRLGADTDEYGNLSRCKYTWTFILYDHSNSQGHQDVENFDFLIRIWAQKRVGQRKTLSRRNLEVPRLGCRR
jgi:hypothetical protein